jgi:hypothetical protein
MNAILAARLAKPRQPQPSALHDARGLREGDLAEWAIANWHQHDPEPDVLDYVCAAVGE